MPRKAIARVNARPRRETSLTDRQEKFARVYAATMDVDLALKESGYKFKDEANKRSLKCRLLRIPNVMMLIDEIKARAIEKCQLDAQGVILRFQLIYAESMREKNWLSAINALRELAKIGGFYEKHNRQKTYTQADVEKLRSELEAAGFDFSRVALVSPN